MDFSISKFEKFSDKRGDLIVFLKNSHLTSHQKKFGQIYFVTFSKKDIVRGQHYHKKIREWFGVVHGKLEVKLCDVISGEKKRFVINGNSKKYVRLEIGPHIAHAFKCLSANASLLNYTDKEWHEKDVYRYILYKV